MKKDPLFNKALLLLKENSKLNKPTASFLQRRLDITWERAYKIMQQLVKEGHVDSDYEAKNLMRFRRKQI